MKADAHINKSMRLIISLAVIIILSVAVIIGTDAYNNSEVNKYTEPAKISFEIVSTRELDISDMNAQEYNVSKVLEAYDAQSRLVAYVVENSETGYNQASPIKISSVISADGAIICSVNILSQQETEYLGVRIAEDEFLNQFEGRYFPIVSSDSDDKGSKIDTISNSTISSQAVIDGVNKAQSFVKANFLSAQIVE
ncbi:MAG: FMN-binding protein [Eubacterium sp.]|nr:FMN-binding protein [Eubacterium sp.]